MRTRCFDFVQQEAHPGGIHKRKCMRRLILLGLVALTACPAMASRRVTVAQLEQIITADNRAHHTDQDTARQISKLEMAERLTDTTLNGLVSTLNLEPQTALALRLLADQSAFLDPPANEFAAMPPPDAQAQQRMLRSANLYSVDRWIHLPNFFATRETHRFDDTAQSLHPGDWPVRDGLHLVNTSSREITFRAGKEVQEAIATGTASAAMADEEAGLRSWGEFGPAMEVVLSDLSGHPPTFSHWEKTPDGVTAVFHYKVPRESSHYAVTFSYHNVNDRSQLVLSNVGRGQQEITNASIPGSAALHTYSETPAYHGSISIDPTTGAVVRITITADLGYKNPLLRAETAVEYGPITIGDRQFICPTRSIAVSLEPGNLAGCRTAQHSADSGGDNPLWQSAVSSCENDPVLLINETRFIDYHRLGSSARILTDVAGITGAPPANAAPDSASPTATRQMPASEATSSQPPANSANEFAAPSAQNPQQPAMETASAAPPLAPVAAPEPAAPEISVSDAKDLPDSAPGPPQNGASGFSLKVTSRLVDVGLVAYDKKGHPVTDLNAGDFALYDNGQKQDLHFFGAPVPRSALAVLAAAQPVSQPAETDFSNLGVASGSAPMPEAGTTILLIDESHIAWSDMSNARGQILKFLGSLAPGERVGLYVMNGLGFHVLTEVTDDHAALIARMQKFMPDAQSVSLAQEEETRNRQHFDEVHNVADLNSVNGNRIDAVDGAEPIDPHLLTMGDVPVRASMIILAQVARHLQGLPGHKNLIWVSSDNVFADWRDQAVGIDKSTEVEKAYEMRAQEAMNNAHAAVYPFDVSQLEGAAVGPDLQNQYVKLTPAAQDAASLGHDPSAPPEAMSRVAAPGRVTAEMNQDIHPVQEPVREVAVNTGGRVIRRASDLTAQLRAIMADGDDTYMLSFSPSGPPDGQYHTITVKLTDRRGLTLRYRTGYLFDKEPTTLKERFQQAVWKPSDVSEIAVTAHLAAASAGTSVQLNIAAADLGLEQQAGRWMDKLDIFFIERDDAGLHARVEGETLGLRLKPDTYQQMMPKGIPFDHVVKMQQGMSSLRVLVVDENTGRMGTVTIPGSALKAGG